MRSEFPLDHLGRPFGFYVYRLIDPRSALPFYVGKGQGSRAWRHERDVQSGRSGCNQNKTAAIRDILSAGLRVTVEIVAVYDLEADALEHEFQLVDTTPGLTNVMAGGIGAGMSPEAQARLSHCETGEHLAQTQSWLNSIERPNQDPIRLSRPAIVQGPSKWAKKGCPSAARRARRKALQKRLADERNAIPSYTVAE